MNYIYEIDSIYKFDCEQEISWGYPQLSHPGISNLWFLLQGARQELYFF